MAPCKESVRVLVDAESGEVIQQAFELAELCATRRDYTARTGREALIRTEARVTQRLAVSAPWGEQ